MNAVHIEQLTDTSSRTGKQAPDDVKDPIINTREDKLYAPADKATVDRIAQKPEVQKLMEPGDKLLVMDSFQTPGKTGRSLGADRNARLVIEKPNSAKRWMAFHSAKSFRVPRAARPRRTGGRRGGS